MYYRVVASVVGVDVFKVDRSPIALRRRRPSCNSARRTRRRVESLVVVGGGEELDEEKVSSKSEHPHARVSLYSKKLSPKSIYPSQKINTCNYK